MSATLAIAASVASISATNSARSQAQQKALCELTTRAFDNKTATVQQKQAYAECIELLYPQEGILLIWTSIVVAAIGAVIGALHSDNHWFSRILFGLLGASSGVLATLVVADIARAIQPLFNA